MTATTQPASSGTDDVRGPDTLARAEAAWLVAITQGDDAQRALMLPDCVIVHGPVGDVHDRERFLAYDVPGARRASRRDVLSEGSPSSPAGTPGWWS
ncbi:hypothetical protein [Streptomyces sp. DSM 15324]|uniref:hypothetical protein n=1 Tax=Streptomyces sp. DSM 15324 TaxID=1739111 RepID=UPI00074AE496|nr:hypothetical protein [Streptomyces sp. DSM 15324]KUO09727.1 hypothetical protein AQJ58_23480 [Streptomyces sp. DSM 15324]